MPLTREDLPGTPLSDAQVRRREVLTHELDPNARYAWDTGIAIGRFLEGLRRGHLLAPCTIILSVPILENCWLIAACIP